MHTLSTKTDINKTDYNYRGVIISVIEYITKDSIEGTVLEVKTIYECNCSVFHKLEDAENFVEDVFFSGDDAIIPTDKVFQGVSIVFDDPSSNWFIVSDNKGILTAIARDKTTGCKDCHFGDKNHIKRLISQGYGSEYINYITEDGLKLMSGLYSRLHKDSKGNRFSVLSF